MSQPRRTQPQASEPFYLDRGPGMFEKTDKVQQMIAAAKNYLMAPEDEKSVKLQLQELEQKLREVMDMYQEDKRREKIPPFSSLHFGELNIRAELKKILERQGLPSAEAAKMIYRASPERKDVQAAAQQLNELYQKKEQLASKLELFTDKQKEPRELKDLDSQIYFARQHLVYSLRRLKNSGVNFQDKYVADDLDKIFSGLKLEPEESEKLIKEAEEEANKQA